MHTYDSQCCLSLQSFKSIHAHDWLFYVCLRQLLVKGTNARPTSTKPVSLLHPPCSSAQFLTGPSVEAADKGANQPQIEWLSDADT